MPLLFVYTPVAKTGLHFELLEQKTGEAEKEEENSISEAIGHRKRSSNTWERRAWLT